MWVSINKAFEVELSKKPIIYPLKPLDCEVCKTNSETRCGVCFDCKDLIEIDLENATVREIANPSHSWPYVYHSGKPAL